jgi:hypothetical protein
MAQIPFSPPQVQAALQNPTRFPDQKLQQYAQKGSPTGQVSPMMAQQEMASRGQERQAFQRQQAMQNNPENSPTIFQQKDAELEQARAALQQQQQQVGMMGAMLAKKQQDLQARERGIAALPMRQDMFTAMDGGIVFRGGGQVERFKDGGDLGAFNEERPVSRTLPNEDDPLQARINRILAARQRLTGGITDAMLTEKEREEVEGKERERKAQQYERYKQGIAGLDEETAKSIRGKPADIWQGIAAGLPTDTRGLRLAGLLSGVAKGIAGERGRVDEREREAAKYMAEARRKNAMADLAEERNQDEFAIKARQAAQTDRLKAFEILKADVSSEVETERAVAGLEEARRTRDEAREEKRLERAERRTEREDEKAFREKMIRLESSLRPRDFSNRLLDMASNPKDPNHEYARKLLDERGGRGGAAADGRPTYDQIYDNALKRFQSMDVNKVIKAAAKDPKNPRALTENDVFNMVLDEEEARVKQKFGENAYRGQGGKGATPAAGASGKVDTNNPLLK